MSQPFDPRIFDTRIFDAEEPSTPPVKVRRRRGGFSDYGVYRLKGE